jgi:phosphoribosylformylglycinamidine synthase
LFVNKGGFTIGICNGFQVLIQLGAFSGIRGHRKITLATNDHGAFLDRWVGLELTDCAKKSDWFRDLSGTFYMPMRHKEGRIVLKDESTQVLFPLRYEEEVNGSYARSAAVLDQSGRTLGMMPHPEAATHGFLSPLRQTTEEKKLNARKVQKIFENAIQGAKS